MTVVASAALIALALTPVNPASAGTATAVPRAGSTPPPGIDPEFIYSQLAYMATHFQRREAGYRAGASGHRGFARYWTSEMLKLLGPFGATARNFPFKIRGWIGRPATAPAVNVEVTVPGVTHPAKVVVIGCHYDGEAISTQSAYDDASGCAVELGVAEAMARFWRTLGVYPARTLRFVIFDAEEQGVFGSFDYVNHEANGSLRDIAAMFNEESNGIGYPVRFLGNLAHPLMPTYIYAAPAKPNVFFSKLALSPAQAAANRAFAGILTKSVAGAFAAFRQLGYRALTYHGRGGRPVWQPIFTPAATSQVRVTSDNVGSSDQVPFTLAGIPDAMFLGNVSYYDPRAPAASYPFDRPQDTIELMNTFADGGAGQSQALTMALGLPGMLTTWMLSQQDVLGQARADRRPIVAIGSIGQVVPNRAVTLTATGYLPGTGAASHGAVSHGTVSHRTVGLSYSWTFGDGTSASGPIVRHSYASAGTYPLRLAVSAPHRPVRLVSVTVSAGRPSTQQNPYVTKANEIPKTTLEGIPPANPEVILPTAKPGLSDRVGRAALAVPVRPARPRVPASSPTGWILAIIAIVVAAGVLTVVGRRQVGRRRAARNRSAA